MTLTLYPKKCMDKGGCNGNGTGMWPMVRGGEHFFELSFRGGEHFFQLSLRGSEAFFHGYKRGGEEIFS